MTIWVRAPNRYSSRRFNYYTDIPGAMDLLHIIVVSSNALQLGTCWICFSTCSWSAQPWSRSWTRPQASFWALGSFDCPSIYREGISCLSSEKQCPYTFVSWLTCQLGERLSLYKGYRLVWTTWKQHVQWWLPVCYVYFVISYLFKSSYYPL